MSDALILGLSHPLDCCRHGREYHVHQLNFFSTHNVAAHGIQECVEHVRMFPEVLPSFSLPLREAEDIPLNAVRNRATITRTSLGCASSKGTARRDMPQEPRPSISGQ